MKLLTPLFFGALLLTSGCSKFLEKFSRIPEGMTAVKVGARSSSPSVLNTMIGGIMVYAVRTTDGYRQSIRLDHESHLREMILPNGSYNFVAVGWAGPALTGNPKCGFHSSGSPVTLTGAATTVPIALSDAACDNNIFGTSPIYRTGQTFNFLRLKFCGGAVNMSSFTGSTNCDSTRESYRFFRGTAGITGTDEAFPDAHSGRLVYLADLHAPGRKELFSAPLSGVGTVKQSNPHQIANHSVKSFVVIPGTGKVIYMADEETWNANEAYISVIGQPGAQKISGALGAFTGVKKILLAGGGNYLVFAGEMEATNKIEVYSVNLATNARVKLSTTANGTGVSNHSGNWMMKVTPDGNHVVFSGQFDSNTTTDLYSASVTGAAGTAIKLTNTAQTDLIISQFEITHDSSLVVWKGNHDVSARQDLYFSPVAGPAGTYTRINSSTNNGTSNNPFFLSKNSKVVAFLDDVNTVNYYDLYTADLSVSSPFNRARVHSKTGTFSEVHNLKFSPDNSQIVYFSNPTGSAYFSIFTATAGTASSFINRDHSSADSMPYSAGGGAGDGPIQVSPTGKVYYKGTETTFNADYSLYSFSFSDGNMGVRVSQTRTSGKSMGKFSVGLGKIFYSFSDASPTAHELFGYTPGSSFFDIPVLGPRLATVTDVHALKPEENIPQFPNMIALDGKASVSGPTDIYVLTDYTNPSSLRKLTRAYDDANGAGRFRISLLEFSSDGAGNLVNSTPGISSTCLTGPSVDGQMKDLTTENILFPAGDGTPNGLFALAIDVYGEALDCSGPFQRVLLPKGLASPNSSPQAGKIKAADSGGPVLFIKD